MDDCLLSPWDMFLEVSRFLPLLNFLVVVVLFLALISHYHKGDPGTTHTSHYSKCQEFVEEIDIRGEQQACLGKVGDKIHRILWVTEPKRKRRKQERTL